MKCSVDSCDAPVVNSRGWCRRHYHRWYRHGDPLIVKKARPARATISVGDKCGAFTVVAYSHNANAKRFYRCVCRCGAERVHSASDLGRVLSCGCIGPSPSRTHGASNTPTYRSWHAMVHRCTNPKNVGWEYYGGRGIAVCDRWNPKMTVLAFENFRDDVGERPDAMSIDRIDPDGDYEPENVRWATRKQQRANQRRKA